MDWEQDFGKNQIDAGIALRFSGAVFLLMIEETIIRREIKCKQDDIKVV